MCSIFGAYGPDIDSRVVEQLREAARDRGRDGGRMETYTSSKITRSPAGDWIPYRAVLGNWRATPTTEVSQGDLQPYDKLVHNGTIANDKALGIKPGEIDSQALARVLNRNSARTLADSLSQITGSFALGMFNGETILLATNYKPIYYYSSDGGRNTYFSSMERHFFAGPTKICLFGQRPVPVPPYSVLDLATGECISLPRKSDKKAIVIASAGLESTVVATELVREGYEVKLLHFKYGCLAQTQEMNRIPRIAQALGCDWKILPLDYSALDLKGNSHLFAFEGDGGVVAAERELATKEAGAEYAHEWVPARNLVMLSIATAYAEANGYHMIALGNNLEEAGAYPDNEEEFTHLFGGLLPYATQNSYKVEIVSPVGHLMKHEIARLGVELKAPLSLTWSCYRGGDKHCGECGPCFMRKTAFERHGLIDPVFV